MVKPLRIVFMGTPDFVCPTVQALIDGPHDLVCVYTQPPREKGRHKKLEKTPAHKMTEAAGIEVRHPYNFKSADDLEEFQDLELDVAVVAAYGMLLPQEILDAPEFGCINVHPSLLPRWRGPSPIQYAIWKGDAETGVSIMSLEKSMDTGPIIAQEKCNISAATTFETLNTDLWALGTSLLNQSLDALSETRKLQSTPQSDEGVTYCKLLTKEHGRVDWSQTATELNCQIRGLNPWPGTWCLDNNEKRLKIIEAEVLTEKTSEPIGVMLEKGKVSCGNQSVLQFKTVQPENKKPMNIIDVLNGGHLHAGTTLS